MRIKPKASGSVSKTVAFKFSTPTILLSCALPIYSRATLILWMTLYMVIRKRACSSAFWTKFTGLAYGKIHRKIKMSRIIRIVCSPSPKNVDKNATMRCINCSDVIFELSRRESWPGKNLHSIKNFVVVHCTPNANTCQNDNKQKR